MLHALLSFTIAPIQADPLDVVRKAVNLKAFEAKPNWSITGTAKYQGLNCTYDLKVAGESYRETIAGKFNIASGSNGKVAWEQDWNATVRTLHLEDKDNSDAIFAVVTPKWLGKDSPFEVTPKDTTMGDWNLQLKGSPWKGVLRIDVTTHTPKMLTYKGADGDTVMKFTGSNRAGGFWMPTTITIEQAKQINTINIAGVKAVSLFPATAFTPPAMPADTTFAKPQSKIEIKKLFSGHLAVHPLVDGKDVGWFIFDSGAGVTVIDRKTADGLKLPSIGELPLVGIGGVEKGAYRRMKTFTLGGVTVKNTLAADLNLSALGSALGLKLTGIVGYDFISRVVVDLDLKAPAMTLFDPATHKLAESGTWQDAMIEGRTPVVECEYGDGKKGPFRIDTGANGTVVMFSPVVKRFKLMEGQKTTPSALGGVGGMVTVQMGKLSRFVVGGHTFDNPQAMFATSDKGSFADEYLHGNMGHEFLDVFRLVFDYRKSRIGFVPR